ncbi:hypothetical protein H2248_010249 [Termitomyces sp. 'cryptogamus']|nr:hypothetical protein H2248_010249 [Termitomyces sp. 'cryptogamus']
MADIFFLFGYFRRSGILIEDIKSTPAKAHKIHRVYPKVEPDPLEDLASVDAVQTDDGFEVHF